MRKCDHLECTHRAFWVCLRCNFSICGEDCHDEEYPKNPTEGDGRGYCPSCAEFHEEWDEIAWLNRGV